MMDDKDYTNPAEQPAEPLREQEPAPAPDTAGPDPVMELPEIPAATAEPAPQVFDYPPAPPAPKSRSGWKMFAAAAALVAIGAGIGSATTLALGRLQQPVLPIGVPANNNGKAISYTPDNPNAVTAAFNRTAPSVVLIETAAQGYRGQQGEGTGSGFVVDAQGYILTNLHVVESASHIKVRFMDGTELNAELVNADPRKDLAVIKVDPGNRPLVVAPLGDSDQVDVGEMAIAIGAPFGQEFTVTAGIISAKDREAREENNAFTLTGMLQTDAAINPGNSGGPLLNAAGEVIGINTLIDGPIRGNVGLGFAVPINAAKEILPDLISGQKLKYGYLGVVAYQPDGRTATDLTPALARQLGIDATQGAIIGEVVPGTPAEQAGLRSPVFNRRDVLVEADVVTAIDSKPIGGWYDLLSYIGNKKPGDTITMTVVRGSEKLSLTVTLGERPEE